jgi:hypothetical protein
MSKVNINEIDYAVEDDDEEDRPQQEDSATRKQKTRYRRKIENYFERKELRKMLYTDDSYWED